jgi:competence protein ComEC
LGSDPRAGRRRELSLLFLAGGLALGFSARLAAREHLSFGMPPGAGITALGGVLEEDPRLTAGGRGMGRLALTHAFAGAGTRTSARGSVRVFFPDESLARLKRFGRGAELYIEGKLLPPREAGQPPVFSARAVHISAPAGAPDRFRTALRLRLIALYGGKTWGGLALALLLGVRDNLDLDLARAYRDAGLSHILALSGMHLGIIAAVLAFFLKKPLGIRGAAALSSVAIVLYVYLAAVQPSLARSAVMYLLGALCVIANLPRKLPLVLGLSFIIQILIWPASGDTVSFVLSYLALAGILFLGRPLGQLFKGSIPDILAMPLSASLGAFIAGMGVTAFYFSLIQPAGIVAGLVVSPLTTVFMIGALAAPLLSLIPFLSVPVDAVLTALYRLMEALVRAAGSAGPITISAWPLALGVSLIISILIILCADRVTRRGEQLAPFAAP